MKYLLDSNICIHFFRGKFGILAKLEEIGQTQCAISEITLAELVFGAENSNNPEKNHKIIEQFTNQMAILPIFDCIKLYAKEKVKLRREGRMISDFDLIIGCTAIQNDLIMVSENMTEFERISHIQIENWVNRGI